MARVSVSLAFSDYDHSRDVIDGRIPVEGVELVALTFPVEEIFHRFVKRREWDVSEMSLAKYVVLASQHECDLTAIPVFPSRMFRQSSIYVRADSPLESAAALRGCRVGVPEWAQTAAVYTRGWLAHDVGVPLQEIRWVQAGVNEPGRTEKVDLHLPNGVRLERRIDRSLDRLLLDGEIDAVFSAHPPASFASSHLRTLFRNPQEVEEQYFRLTGIFPIMHVVALRREIHAKYPWIAMNLYKALCEALERSLARTHETTASRFPLPWGSWYASRMDVLFGGSPFRYGIDPNRRALEAFLGYAHEQGLTRERLAVEALFAAETLDSYRI